MNGNDDGYDPDCFAKPLPSEEEGKEFEEEMTKNLEKTSRGESSVFSWTIKICALLISLWIIGVRTIIDLSWVITFIGVIVLSLYTFFAPRNLFVTGVREGTAKAIMRGTKNNATFSHFVMSFKKHTFDENWNIIKTAKKQWQLLPGLFWVGIPGTAWVYEHNFAWASIQHDGTLKSEKKLVDYVVVKRDMYAAELKAAEIGESMVPIDLKLLVTLMVKNPYKALFENQEWLEVILNRIRVQVRDIVAGTDDPRSLLTEKGQLGEDIYNKIEEVGLLKYFVNNVGVEIDKYGIEAPDIGMGKFQEIATKEWEAEQKAKADVKAAELGIIVKTHEGDGYKAFRTREAEADKDYYDVVYSKITDFGDIGVTLQLIKALEEAAKGPSNTIIPFGLMKDIVSQMVGGNFSPEIASRTDNLFKILSEEKEDMTLGELERIKDVIESKIKESMGGGR